MAASAAKSRRVAEEPAQPTPWPADRVERWPVAALVPYAKNARTHSPEQVAQIARSIEQFGWTFPVLVDEQKTIIAGHGRVLAAQKLGLVEVPTMVAAGWTDEQRRLYVIADNKLGLNAGWDDAILALEITDLQAADADLALTGFSGDEIKQLFGKAAAKAGKTDPEETPEAPADPVSRLGDVWVLGRHRITCGDCTDAAVWDRLGANADVGVFTSPPYGVGENAKLRDQYKRGAAQRQSLYHGHADDPDEWPRLMHGWLDIALPRSAVIFCNVQMLANNKRALVGLIDHYSDHLVDIATWDKGHAAPQMQSGVMANTFEWVIILSPKTPASRAIPMAKFHGTEQNILRINPKGDNKFADTHRAAMPIGVALWAMAISSECNDWIEPFSGTGTTIIAAEMTGRRCFAIELNPAYVDVAVKRWEAFTGEAATLEGDGRTFAEIAANAQRP